MKIEKILSYVIMAAIVAIIGLYLHLVVNVEKGNVNIPIKCNESHHCIIIDGEK